MMTDLSPLLSQPGVTIAVIGATDHVGKYGGIVYRDLKRKGYRVFAVNPYRDSVDGDPCWKSVLDLPETPTIADFVIPAKRGLAVLDECEQRGWLSERRVVERLVHARRSRFGARRIEPDLRQKGVSEVAVSAALAALKGDELDAARSVWRRKFGGKQPRGPADRARQVRFMQGRGFDLEVILKVIKGGDEE